MESIINKLQEDVIIQILVGLPVTSLLRFRLVCKAWLNLIKSPNFISMHLNHLVAEHDHYVLVKRCLQDRVTNVLSIHSNSESLTIVSPDVKIPHLHNASVEVFGPCNGLVCITSFKTIVLSNPATREFTLLPERPFGCPQDMYCSYNGAGFGFDANTNDYKVIRILSLVHEDDYTFRTAKAELYRYSTDSWVEIDYALPHVWYAPCFEVLFHGVTHWRAMREEGERVLAFNFISEVFQEFEFPDDCPPFDGKRKSLTILHESLALLYYTDPQTQVDEQFIFVWVMKEHGISKSWTKQFTIGPLSEIQHPLTSWRNSAILIERTNGQLISCVIDTQEVKEFDIFGDPHSLRARVYKESLISTRK